MRRRRVLALLCVGGVLGSSALLGSAPVGAASDSGAVLRYGKLTLGVNAYGDLNYDCTEFEDGGCPGSFYSNGGGDENTSVVGLRRTVGEDDLDGIAPGAPNEGWGIADATTQISGSTNQNEGGPSGLVLDSFTTNGNTATSVTSAGSGEASPRLQVTHVYEPSSDANLFKGTVTVRNTGNVAAGDVRYRRVVDWDVPPTAFDEYVTLRGTPPELLFDSDLFGPNGEGGEGGADEGLVGGGGHTSDPLGPRTYGYSESVCGTGYRGPCQFTDLGDDDGNPTDHGALFDFGLGALAPGQSLTFTLYYGVALSETSALASLRAVGVQTYTLGESSCEFGTVSNCIPPRLAAGDRGALAAPGAGPDEGEPATFMLGFAFARRTDVALTKTASVATATTSDTITYTLTARNTARGTTATGVTVSDPLPAGTTLVSASTGCTGTTTVTCALGDIGSLQSRTVTVRVRAVAAGLKTNRATVSTTATDTNPDNDSATATTLVAQGNLPPVARNDSYSTPSGTELQVGAPGVRGNDSDPDGDPLTAQRISGPSHGTATLAADGTLRYTPDAGYAGTDTLRYRSTDPSGASDTARVRITVEPAAPDTTTPTAPPTDGPTDQPADQPTPDLPTDEPTEEPTDDPTDESATSPTPGPATPSQGPPTVGLRLSNPSVNPGGRLDATGSGCEPGATVRLSIDGRDAGTGTAGADGTFTVPVTAPDLPIGNHTVTAACGTVQQVAPVSFVFVTAASSAPGAKALTVGAMLAFFLLLLTLTLRRPGR